MSLLPAGAALAIFFVAALVLAATPGPSVLYIVSRSVDQGRLAGLVSVLGVWVATVCHVAAAALGVSALLAASALAFSILKYAGAAYLIYLGVRRLLTPDEAVSFEAPARKPLTRLFRDGFLVNLFNPKTALFFYAFLPQFADPARGPIPLQIAILGVLATIVGLASDATYAAAAGTAGDWLRGSRRYRQLVRFGSGSVYVGLGVGALLVSPGSSR
jgi:threonine/homoserine/homoserine lactone efflux protein